MTRSPTNRSTCLAALLALLLAPALAGCGDDGTYTIEEVREGTSRRPVPASSDAARRLGMAGHGERGNMPGAQGASSWQGDTPAGWKALPGNAMQPLAWDVPGSDVAKCTFTVLGSSGGGLVANVNRWRKQMGLGDLTEAEIAALPKAPFAGTEGVLVDVEGTYGGMSGKVGLESARMLGLILDLPNKAVFLKLVGPKDVVGAQEANFKAVAASIQEKPAATATMPPGHGGMAGMPAGHGARQPSLTWQAPEGWVEKPARPMREVTFAPGGDKDTEAYVSILGGDGGGIDMNINRWRQQMGQKSLTPEEVSALPRIEALGREGVLVTIGTGDFTGQSGEKVGEAAMLGFVLVRENDSVFVKMIGPADVVLKEKQNFESFCRSLTE